MTTTAHLYQRRTEAQVRELIESMPHDPETGCWEWDRALNKGYGALGWRGRNYLVHRLAYQLYVADPGGLQVNHHCDNRACCNPEHLYAGTQKDNIDDMLGRERSKAKLSDAQVLEIRGRQGENQSQLGREFGVTQTTISRIQRGKGWQHVAGLELCQENRARLTARDVRLIRELLPGHESKDLAKLFGVSYLTIHNIRMRKSWRHLDDESNSGNA